MKQGLILQGLPTMSKNKLIASSITQHFLSKKDATIRPIKEKVHGLRLTLFYSNRNLYLLFKSMKDLTLQLKIMLSIWLILASLDITARMEILFRKEFKGDVERPMDHLDKILALTSRWKVEIMLYRLLWA